VALYLVVLLKGQFLQGAVLAGSREQGAGGRGQFLQGEIDFFSPNLKSLMGLLSDPT